MSKKSQVHIQPTPSIGVSTEQSTSVSAPTPTWFTEYIQSQFDVAKVAELARLELQPEEEEHLHQEMESIVGYINMLSELDVEGIEPTAHAVPLTNVCREDVAEVSFSRDAMLANAPDVVDEELIKVHQVIESH